MMRRISRKALTTIKSQDRMFLLLPPPHPRIGGEETAILILIFGRQGNKLVIVIVKRQGKKLLSVLMKRQGNNLNKLLIVIVIENVAIRIHSAIVDFQHGHLLCKWTSFCHFRKPICQHVRGP